MLNAGSRVQRPLGMLVCALLLIPGAVAAQTKLEDNVNQAVTILKRFRESDPQGPSGVEGQRLDYLLERARRREHGQSRDAETGGQDVG